MRATASTADLILMGARPGLVLLATASLLEAQLLLAVCCMFIFWIRKRKGDWLQIDLEFLATTVFAPKTARKYLASSYRGA